MLKNRKRDRILALIGAVLLTMMPVFTGPVFADVPIEMKAEVGFEDQVKLGKWVTVRVHLVNRGPEIKGVLAVEPTDPRGYRTHYQVAVDLPAGAEKLVRLNVPVTELQRNLPVKFFAGGKEVKSVNARMQAHSQFTLLAGVFASDPTTMNHLAAVKLPGEGFSIKVLHPDPEVLPDNSLVLENLDIIVLNDFDTGQLTAKQRQALVGWVEQGGMLILGGGPNGQKTLASLPPELVPVELTGTRTMTSLPALAGFAGSPLGQTEFTMTESRLTGGEALVSQGQLPVLVETRKGSGTVYFVALDLALDPVAAWQGNELLWGKLVARANPFNMTAAVNKDAMVAYGGSNLEYAVRNIPAMDLPSARLLGWLLIGYLAAAGPVNYLVLKRFDRREWAWVTIPLLAVLFIAGMYSIGFKGKGRDVLTNTVSIVHLDSDLDVCRVQSHVGVFAPSKDTYQVELPGEKLVSVASSSTGRVYDQQTGSLGPIQATVKTGATTLVEFQNMNMWSMRSLMYEDYVRSPGKVECRLLRKEGKLYGEVTNRTNLTLEDSVVFSRYGYQMVGTLKPGETGQFPLDFQPGPNQMGPSVIYQIYNPQPAATKSQTAPRPDRKRMRYQMILEGVFGWGGDRTLDEITFAAWSEQPFDQITVNQGKPRSYQTTLFLAPLEFQSDEPLLILPAGMVIGRLVASEGVVHQNPEEYFIQEGSATFQLQLPETPDTVVYNKVALELAAVHHNRTGTFNIEAWLYNWETESWDEFSATPGTNTVPDPVRYISRDGLLQVKLATGSQGTSLEKGLSIRGISLSAEGQVTGR